MNFRNSRGPSIHLLKVHWIFGCTAVVTELNMRDCSLLALFACSLHLISCALKPATRHQMKTSMLSYPSQCSQAFNCFYWSKRVKACCLWSSRCCGTHILLRNYISEGWGKAIKKACQILHRIIIAI